MSQHQEATVREQVENSGELLEITTMTGEIKILLESLQDKV